MDAWQNAATTDPATISQWFGKDYPGFGVGVATGEDSGLFVLDVDTSNGKTGDETLHELEQKYGPLPETAHVITGTGGSHYYFRYPEGVEIRNNAGTVLGAWLDIRGEGGQVVAPPTMHPCGTRYQWEGGEPGEVADAPVWLVEMLTAKPEPVERREPVTVATQDGARFTLVSPLNDSPAERYNASTTWAELLSGDGWELEYTDKKGTQNWRRPGKNRGEGTSATVRDHGEGPLTVFTTSVPWLESKSKAGDGVGSYSRFQYMAARDHQGDYSAAAKAFRKSQPSDTLVETASDTRDLPLGVDGLNMTDSGNAGRLIANHGESVRYLPKWKQWFVWDGSQWRSDPSDVRVAELAKSVSSRLWQRIAKMPRGADRDSNVRHARASESAASIRNAVGLARGIPGVEIDNDDLDNHPWLLNLENGTLDLRTATLKPHDPEQLHTLMAGARWEPEAKAPRFDAFLTSIFPDEELRSYVQRAVGYSLTGSTGEQVMFLAIGNGSNGKSTLIEAVSKVMGDYAGPVAKDLIITQRFEAHPTSLADLNRLRFAVAMETEATNTLAEARVKALTGGDRVKARRMGENFWDFEPTHKLWLAANHLPTISGTDEGIWRRMRVIPFAVQIDEAHRDPNLPIALANELPGILRWAVEGCLQWQRQGLNTPAIVTETTQTYRDESDWFPQFLDECGWKIADGMSTTTKALYESFSDFAKSNDLPANRRVLSKELTKKRCRPSRFNSARTWLGIGKRTDFV